MDFDSTGAFEVLDWTDARQPDEGALTRSLHLARDANGELYLTTESGDIFQVVPEPGTLGLMGVGMIALATVFVRRTTVRQRSLA
ncbi:MAG: PEP-CTERM sorting domain-containing protein [Terrimicrobiaceae bacterium]